MTEPPAWVAESVGDDDPLASIAPPRSNGELVFEEPWQARAFAMVSVLAEQGRFEWSTFQGQLIAAIAADEQRPYYESWVVALEAVSPVTTSEVDARTAAYAARPHGHDH